MSKALLVALGGAAGALARYWLGGKINSYWPMPFPLGTFVVNVSGSFIIGFTMALIGERMRGRSGHYMPVSLLDSQLATLEEPGDEDDIVMLPVDLPPDAQLRRALQVLAAPL